LRASRRHGRDGRAREQQRLEWGGGHKERWLERHEVWRDSASRSRKTECDERDHAATQEVDDGWRARDKRSAQYDGCGGVTSAITQPLQQVTNRYRGRLKAEHGYSLADWFLFTGRARRQSRCTGRSAHHSEALFVGPLG
jgi:hypothetical protein